MSARGSTKEKIVQLIAEGNNTLTMLSQKLELAPSTVSKHLQDLQDAGVIQLKEAMFAKKWKYYQLSPTEMAQMQESGWITVAKIRAPLLIMLAIALAMGGFLFYYANATANQTANIPISITDPPQVPIGTQALYINYSSLKVAVWQNGSLRWIGSNASGRLDLITLVNQTQILANLNLPQNSTVHEITFRIASASVVIDNTTYGVYVTNSNVTAQIVNSGRVNRSSGLLLDLSPVVTATYSDNITRFVMMPAVRAVIVSGHDLNGQKASEENGENHYLLPDDCKRILSQMDTNLTITAASLQTAQNTTSLSVSLQNNGRSNVTVFGVLLYGNQTMPEIMIRTGGDHGLPGPRIGNHFYWNGNGRGLGPVVIAPKNGTLYNESNTSISINASQFYRFWRNGSVRIKLPRPTTNVTIINVGMPYPPERDLMGDVQSLNFFVDRNGSLSISGMGMSEKSSTPLGYTLTAGSSSSFSFTGQINSSESPIPLFTPSPGKNYSIAIITDRGVIATNVTAT
jgi:DNA-binding transcriptional ArsR family regulator